jgi:hypothetical protein
MRTAALLGIAGLAAFITYCFRQGAGERGAGARARSDLRRWEGEGGATLPSPETRALPPDSADGSFIRH